VLRKTKFNIGLGQITCLHGDIAENDRDIHVLRIEFPKLMARFDALAGTRRSRADDLSQHRLSR
jgi:hypothetical protein